MSAQQLKNIAIIAWSFVPPAQNGGQRRLEGMIRAIVGAGWNVHLLLIGNDDIKSGSSGGLAWRKVGVASVHGRNINRFDRYFGQAIKCFYRGYPFYSAVYSPFFRRWVSQIINQTKPQIVMTNFIDWLPLLKRHTDKHLFFDYVDVWTRYQKHFEVVASRFSSAGWKHPEPDDPIISETIFNDYEQIDLQEELNELKNFHTIFAISANEAQEIRNNLSGPAVEYVPMCENVVDSEKTYDGNPVMVSRWHPFNAQGYSFFIQRILPIVLEINPKFRIRVVGNGTEHFPLHPNVDLCGFINDLSSEYYQAAFAIVPILGGTGQLTRVTEAMAHGLPVIATSASARSSPILHGINGFVADNPKSFAEFILTFHENRHLVRSMGMAAKKTIEINYSFKCLQDRVAAILNSLR